MVRMLVIDFASCGIDVVLISVELSGSHSLHCPPPLTFSSLAFWERMFVRWPKLSPWYLHHVGSRGSEAGPRHARSLFMLPVVLPIFLHVSVAMSLARLHASRPIKHA